MFECIQHSNVGQILLRNENFIFSDRILSPEFVNITGEDWGWIVLVAIMSILAFWSQMASFQWIDASTMGALQTVEVLLAYLVQILVMNDEASVLAIIGEILIDRKVLNWPHATFLYRICFNYD